MAFVSWMVFVTFFSLHSLEGVSASTFEIPHLDKIVHFTFYFVACFLGVLFLRERSKGLISMTKAILIMVLLTIAFGILIEFLQYTMTTNRMGDYLDGLANSIGSICGAMALKVCFSRKRQLKWKY